MRTRNWTVILLGSGLFLPLNLHFNDFCYELWGRAIAYKQSIFRVLREKSWWGVLEEFLWQEWFSFLAHPLHSTHPQHGCRHPSRCVIIKELLKVKAGIRPAPSDFGGTTCTPPWFVNTQHAVPVLKWELTLVQRVICLLKYASKQLLWPKASGFQFLHWILWSIAKTV